MEAKDKEEIREAVRESYGKIAGDGDLSFEKSDKPSCCGALDIAADAGTKLSCCGPIDISANNLSEIMGYTKEDIGSVPEGANMGLGCGNPVALASLKSGETAVDLGSGGGFDCFLAAQKVGEAGKVIGVDMTPDMISKARKNAEKIGAKNIEFRLGEIEHLPIADNSVDIIMSNCVINLSPDKASVYKDAFRVLKPGGVFLSVEMDRKDHPEDLAFLADLIESGQIKPVIDRRYPLEQMAEAHRYVETLRKKGNVVITVAPNHHT